MLLTLVEAFNIRRNDVISSIEETKQDLSNNTFPTEIESDAIGSKGLELVSLRPDYVPLRYSLKLMMYRSALNQLRQPALVTTRITQV